MKRGLGTGGKFMFQALTDSVTLVKIINLSLQARLFKILSMNHTNVTGLTQKSFDSSI